MGLLTAVEGVVAYLKKFQRLTREGFTTFNRQGFQLIQRQTQYIVLYFQCLQVKDDHSQ